MAQFGLASGLMAKTIGRNFPLAGFSVVARSVFPVTVAAAGLPGVLTTGQAAPRALTTGQAARAWWAWPAPRRRQCCYRVPVPVAATDLSGVLTMGQAAPWALTAGQASSLDLSTGQVALTARALSAGLEPCLRV